MATRVRVAGTAIATRISTGIAVQMISIFMLPWNCAGTTPFDLR